MVSSFDVLSAYHVNTL